MGDGAAAADADARGAAERGAVAARHTTDGAVSRAVQAQARRALARGMGLALTLWVALARRLDDVLKAELEAERAAADEQGAGGGGEDGGAWDETGGADACAEKSFPRKVTTHGQARRRVRRGVRCAAGRRRTGRDSSTGMTVSSGRCLSQKKRSGKNKTRGQWVAGSDLENMKAQLADNIGNKE